MSCACGKSSYNGKCGCQSNYEGMKNHLTDQQIKEVRRKFEDKLFAQAYYADEESYSALFGIGNKKKEANQASASDAPAKKKFNLGNIAEKGIGLLKKVGGLLQGEQPVYTGEYEGIKYETNINAEREITNNNTNNTKKPDEKKGIPKPVIYTGIAVLVILLLFIVYKVISANRPVVGQA